jgi:hypothetical protein
VSADFSGAILVVFVLLLQEINHESGIFLLCNSSSIFWMCASIIVHSIPPSPHLPIIGRHDINEYILDLDCKVKRNKMFYVFLFLGRKEVIS